MLASRLPPHAVRPMLSPLRCAVLASTLLLACLADMARSAPIVVETPALTPAQQQAKFRLPPGFEIQLVAAEPDIGKPMNLNFDARGRLWITHSLEYPFPTAGEGVQPRDLNQDQITDHAPRDRLSCFESIDPDGRGRGLFHFAEGLNIPIGQHPLVVSHEETAALGYSIPAVRLYQRAAGNGLADTSRVLFTGFGNVDTHGMCSSFTRGFDGWIYANHGFRNTSRITRPGGPELLVLNSGNTIRFSPDGSRLEQFTKGQVNPFGMTFDTWGNLYNADCHSMPVTCLLRGATYTSFGKPHDGLGFGPNMIDHNHGSTGICGVAWYDAPQFPEEFRDCLYICNPVNGHVHRDRLQWTGSSPKVDSQPEFITCDDGWFRPVDVKLGPDGALYIADFYNAIIGHYEAPLQHPLRDRTHARIWRVVATQNSSSPPPAHAADLTRLDDDALAARLGDPNFTVRLLATNLLVDRYSPPVTSVAGAQQIDDRAGVLRLLENIVASEHSGASHVVHAAWAWSRLLPAEHDRVDDVLQRLTTHAEPVVRTHAARLIGATVQADVAASRPRRLAILLGDDDARVRRSAVEALALHPGPSNLAALLAADEQADPGDSHLKHAIRIALRSQLETASPAADELAALSLGRQRLLASVVPAVNPLSSELATWLRGLIAREAKGESAVPRAEWRQWIPPASRFSDDSEFKTLATLLMTAAGDDREEQLASARACLAGRQAGGLDLPAPLTRWAERLALQLLSESREAKRGWTYRPLPGTGPIRSPFGSESRQLAGRRPRATLISSLPGGESLTGVYRSREFPLPAELSFWLAGHNSHPSAPDSRRNLVRLVEANTGAVLQEAFPPRNDIAQRVVWDLQKWNGKTGAIEIVDANAETAYAWLAAGQFSLAELNDVPSDAGATAVALVKDFRLVALEPRLQALLMASDAGLRAHAAAGLVALKPDARVHALLLWTADDALPAVLETRLWEAVRTRDPILFLPVLRDLLAGASTETQRKVADLLVTDRAGAELLVELAAEGRLAPQLLQQPALQFKLAALNAPELNARVQELTQSLPAPDVALATLMADRRKTFDPAACSTDNGKAAFVKRCAVCHQIGNEGAKIGPQLDGVGIRGLDRLLEDILDPNRNVDAAFRSSVIALTDGRILTGLKRREEGTDVIFANSEGKEFRIPAAEIDELKLSPTSLMPGNFGELVPPEEMADILAWLLTQKPEGK